MGRFLPSAVDHPGNRQTIGAQRNHPGIKTLSLARITCV